MTSSILYIYMNKNIIEQFKLLINQIKFFYTTNIFITGTLKNDFCHAIQ